MEVNGPKRSNRWEVNMKLKMHVSALALTASALAFGTQANAWSLEEAAKT